ncbi:MAG: hypothetical protein IPL01_22665 [Acidobacteria bacterium]|nr:hypothetical protein [Acidobacteriota bacterium]
MKLRLRADFTGVIRIFCEGYGFTTGSAIVATIAMNKPPLFNRDERTIAALFRPANFLPAVWQQPSIRGKLQIAKIDQHRHLKPRSP